MTGSCAHCGRALPPGRRLWCDDGCRKRAHRRRQAGLPEDALPYGGRHGRLSLDRTAILEATWNRPKSSATARGLD
jgi:hypothetical protein